MDGIVRIPYVDNMNVFYTEKESSVDPTGFATTNNPCETFNALLKKYTGRRRFYVQRLLRVTMTVIEDAPKRTPITQNEIQVAFTSRAAGAMIKTGKVLALATDNPALCHVKQLSKNSTLIGEEHEELCQALDSPFRASSEVEHIFDHANLLLAPALLVREQRARAAQHYKNVVSWSLWYAHTVSMPEGGWIVDVDRCIWGCKHYAKLKSCCHILVGRKANKMHRPGVDDGSEKLYNRLIRKKASTRSFQTDVVRQQSGALLPMREMS
ncbi:hypothetical protein F444_01076 [Phytophthora nicotianae P1976]|uniref:MULE transposase domain-containing protein n=2 Tax=Phytophthora nicotianae TaxID=4792 RepID=A0A081B1U0_PHYNI|nr:hypothetical protein F444_01076 [Phytophthora nicotianae P1976]